MKMNILWSVSKSHNENIHIPTRIIRIFAHYYYFFARNVTRTIICRTFSLSYLTEKNVHIKCFCSYLCFLPSNTFRSFSFFHSFSFCFYSFTHFQLISHLQLHSCTSEKSARLDRHNLTTLYVVRGWKSFCVFLSAKYFYFVFCFFFLLFRF
jgi:hypothetical protein